jgi:hypothetical protein
MFALVRACVGRAGVPLNAELDGRRTIACDSRLMRSRRRGWPCGPPYSGLVSAVVSANSLIEVAAGD